MKRTKIWKRLLVRNAGLPQWRMKQMVRMGPMQIEHPCARIDRTMVL